MCGKGWGSFSCNNTGYTVSDRSHSGYGRTHKNKTSGSEMFRKPLYGGKGNYTITKVGVICYFDTDVFKRVARGNHD